MTRSYLGRRVRRVAPWLGAALLLLGVLGACNYRWKAVLSTFQFNSMDFVSVFPAHKDDTGNYERQCFPVDGKPVNALLFSVNLVGTDTNRADGGDPSEVDNDTSIRPGDLVKKGGKERTVAQEGVSISAEDFVIDLDCFETYPDRDLTGLAECQGRTGPRTATPRQLAYRSFFSEGLRPEPSDRDAMAVAILVDQSGSMKGFVAVDSEAEAHNADTGPWDTINFKKYASDPDGHRITAIRNLFNLLNPNDRAAVFQFSEAVGSEPAVVCDLAPDGTEADRRRECFGTNREVATESKAFGQLLSGAKGRTPLWAAVSDVYDYMKEDINSRVRHILVISDGPDTCHPDSPDFQPTLRKIRKSKFEAFDQANSCSTVAFEDFLAKVDADLKDGEGNYIPGNRAPVHVSFIQFQAPGYLARDARQQDIACRTGGHYQFINADDLEAADTVDSPLKFAMERAVGRQRRAMAGSWTLALDVPDLENQLLPLGSQLAVQGDIKLKSNALTPDAQVDLRVGYVEPGATGRNVPKLDLRGSIRVPGTAGDSCTWFYDASVAADTAVPSLIADCRSAAVEATSQVCSLDTVPNALREGGACGGGDATCCYGRCEACRTLDALCNPTANLADGATCCGAQGGCVAGVCAPANACVKLDQCRLLTDSTKNGSACCAEAGGNTCSNGVCGSKDACRKLDAQCNLVADAAANGGACCGDAAGTCADGECLVKDNPCKVLAFQPATGDCAAEANRADDVPCGAGKVCKAGVCTTSP